MKILYVATVRSHIGQFHMPVIKALKAAGHEVHAAFKDNSSDKQGLDLSCIDKVFEIPFARSPFRFTNLTAYKKLKEIIDEGNYDIIHCHTPMGGVITRLAAKKARKTGTRIIYTAHGFHFYKGAPIKNWLFFYPVEKLLSKYTDCLITINQEDYNCAHLHNFKAKQIIKVNGVGIDLSKFHTSSDNEKLSIRDKLGYGSKDFIMLYAADLSKRKNQKMIFKALNLIKNQIPDFHLLLPGQPILKDRYEKTCQNYGISEKVDFLGYRRDIDKLLTVCDCVISSSRQEGLPINLIEAAASGKYIIATNVRGNYDVVRQSGYGSLIDLNDFHLLAQEILKAYKMNPPTKKDTSRMDVYNEKNIISTIMKIYNS